MALNPWTAALPGQVEKLGLDLGEHRPGMGLEAGVRPLVDIMLGDDHPDTVHR